MASLREKYGKETAMFIGSQRADDNNAKEMWWLFDEEGRPAPLPTSNSLYRTLADCAAKFDRGDDANSSDFAANNIMSPDPRQKIAEGGWCNTSGIVAIAEFPPEETVNNLTMRIIDMPTLTRALRSEVAALDEFAKKQQQDEINKAKQQRPKL